jgi:CO/xanthine dehydrogenase Mo-binding subunit
MEPCAHNPLGAKGCGEAGTIAAPTSLVNAVIEALGGARRLQDRTARDRQSRG